MIKLMIPGFGPLEIHRVVTDYTGTHSLKGVVRRSVKTRLARLARLVEVHVLTIDTFGTVRRELARLTVEVHLLKTASHHDKEKTPQASVTPYFAHQMESTWHEDYQFS